MRTRTALFTFAAGLAALAEAPAGVQSASIPFTGVVIDSANPSNPHCKALADLDGDGRLDIVVASSNGGGMHWYRWPSWTKSAIRASGSWTTDMQAVDIDGDGDTDLVIPNASGVILYRNGGNGSSWTEHNIGAQGANSHDVEVGDINRDGRPDVVTRPKGGGATHVWLQSSPTSWTRVLASSRTGEGTALGDIDNDGDLDIAHNGFWLENAGGAGTTWTQRTIDTNWPADVGVLVADLNGDGRNDVVLAPSESASGRLAWYESATPRTGPWTQHVVDSTVSYIHTFKAADADNDGDLDLVTAEMHQSSDPDEVSVYRNGGNGLSWTQQVLATTGSHNIRVGDVDRDGDLDVMGTNWNDAAPDSAVVRLWRNGLNPGAGTTLDSWARRVVDAARPARAIFAKAGDLDGDGRQDIVSGAWWYRNPGSAGGTWTRATIGSPLNNMAAIHDFDGDGDLDILGTQGAGSASNHSFAWAQNNGAGSFTVRTNIGTGGSGDFLQGVVVDRFTSGGPLEVALSWHNGGGGVQMLTVPSAPAASIWSFRTLSASTQSEDLSAGDIDRDGDKDLLLGTQWLRNNGSSWSVHTLFTTSGSPDRNRLADLNRDGRLDAVIGYEAISTAGKLAWYAQPATATGAWAERIISTSVVGPMSMDVADMDGDGDLDVVVGEHNLSSPSTAKLIVFENADGLGGAWRSHVVHTGDEHHDGAQAVDIDGDGDLDVLSIGWGHNRVHLYENLARSGGSTGPPAAPSGLTATAVSSSQIALSWTDASGNETGFKVERATASAGPWTQIALTGAGATTYASTGLSASTTYWYRVRATNAAGDSVYSNAASATTLAAGGTGAVPSAGLQLWLKADAGVTLSGSAVAQWGDQSGGGRHAAQSTASSRPLLITNAVNGKPALQFDGTDDHLTFALPVNGLSGMTIAMVAACSADRTGGTSGAECAALFWNETASWGTVYLSPFQSSVKFRFGTTQTGNKPAFLRPASIGSAFSTTVSVKNGTTDALYVDGVQALSQGGKLSAIAGCRDTGNVGRGYNDNTYFPGRIAEILVYNRALSAAELQSLQDYLRTRYFTAGGSAPPAVALTSPANGARFAAGANISLQATASDSDGTIARVEFFRGTTKIGEDTAAPYGSTWSAVPAGTYTLTARATDDTGAATTSAPVSITVTATSNAPPSVTITSPANGATFAAPASIALQAAASDSDGTVAKVEFFQGTTKLGEDLSAPYGFPWSNVPAGTYALTARATDSAGASTTSAAVSVTVTGSSGGSVPAPGLALWLKADAGLTLSGSAVAQWADQSGNNRHAVQATGSARPTLVSGAVQFDGVDDHMTFSLPVNGLSGMTLALVSACSSDRTGGSTNAANAAVFWNETASWGTVYLSPFQTNVKFRFGTTQTGNLPSHTRSSSIGSALSTTIAIKNGTADALYVNGALALGQSGKLSAIAGCRDVGNLGRGYNDNTFFPGRIAELLVYTRALTAAERQSLEAYLQSRHVAVVATAAETAFGVSIDGVSSGRPYSLATAVADGLYYIDRSYTIRSLGAALDGGVLVRTANDDKALTTADHLRLGVNVPATLYVGYDARASAVPAWLGDGTWTLTTDVLQVSDAAASPMRVYRKDVAAGPLVLGANLAGGPTGALTHYVVIVQPSAVAHSLAVPGFPIGPMSPDVWEHAGDADGDGLLDGFEAPPVLDPALSDTDGNGVPDESELAASGGTFWDEQQAGAAAAAAASRGGDGGRCGLLGFEALLGLTLLAAVRRRRG